MYSFVDRGGEEVTLRPENTAGVVRAVLSDGLIHNAPLKFFYNGPMFRYERPQKGRFRQFHQIGVELIGVAQPQGDIEVIALGSRILDALRIRQRAVLELNTLEIRRAEPRIARRSFPIFQGASPSCPRTAAGVSTGTPCESWIPRRNPTAG